MSIDIKLSDGSVTLDLTFARDAFILIDEYIDSTKERVMDISSITLSDSFVDPLSDPSINPLPSSEAIEKPITRLEITIMLFYLTNETFLRLPSDEARKTIGKRTIQLVEYFGYRPWRMHPTLIEGILELDRPSLMTFNIEKNDVPCIKSVATLKRFFPDLSVIDLNDVVAGRSIPIITYLLSDMINSAHPSVERWNDYVVPMMDRIVGEGEIDVTLHLFRRLLSIIKSIDPNDCAKAEFDLVRTKLICKSIMVGREDVLSTLINRPIHYVHEACESYGYQCDELSTFAVMLGRIDFIRMLPDDVSCERVSDLPMCREMIIDLLAVCNLKVFETVMIERERLDWIEVYHHLHPLPIVRMDANGSIKVMQWLIDHGIEIEVRSERLCHEENLRFLIAHHIALPDSWRYPWIADLRSCIDH